MASRRGASIVQLCGIVGGASFALGGIILATHHFKLAIEKKQFKPRGRIVEAFNTKIHMLAEGEKQSKDHPTIVVVGDAGETTEMLNRLQRFLKKDYRVITYDRPGIGFSSKSRTPRHVSNLTYELHAMLKNAGEEGPFIIVGHSLGALVARLFRDRFPADVAGLVLVDPVHEKQTTNSDWKQICKDNGSQMRKWKILADLGFIDIAMKMKSTEIRSALLDKMPEDVRDALSFHVRKSGYWITAINEAKHISEDYDSFAQVLESRRTRESPETIKQINSTASPETEAPLADTTTAPPEPKAPQLPAFEGRGSRAIERQKRRARELEEKKQVPAILNATAALPMKLTGQISDEAALPMKVPLVVIRTESATTPVDFDNDLVSLSSHQQSSVKSLVTTKAQSDPNVQARQLVDAIESGSLKSTQPAAASGGHRFGDSSSIMQSKDVGLEIKAFADRIIQQQRKM